jgi:coenzyme F420-reducing hydrogenase alpha subunit
MELTEEEIEIINNAKRQLKLFEDILKASSVEEIFTLRNNSGLFKTELSEKAKQTSLEEYKELAKESIETFKRILGEENGNN